MAPDDMLDVLTTSGEMGRRILDHDWSSTPLGALAEWPHDLRAAVRLILPSRVPMFLWIGDALTSIYNDAYTDVLGDKHPGALGAPAREVWAEIWEVVGPLTRDVMEQNVTTWSEDLLLYIDRAGFVEETYFTFSYSPYRGGPGGADTGVFCACFETTERVVGERRLSTLRTLGEALVDARTFDDVGELSAAVLEEHRADLPGAALYLRDGDTISRCMATSAFQSLPEQLTPGPSAAARGLIEALPRDWVPVLPVTTWTPVAPDGERPIEQLIVEPLVEPGSERCTGWLVAGLNPCRPVDGGYRSFVALVAHQLATGRASATAFEAERRRAEGLARLDQAKSMFFDDVSHELRTPLTLLLSPLEEALDDREAALPPRQRERVELARRNATRLLKLVNSLLDIARVDGGRMELRAVRTDLGAATADLVAMFRSAFELAGVELVTEVPERPLEAVVDPEMWERIVLNLVSNALKFTLAGRVTVTVTVVDGDVRLTVDDTGIGVAPDEVPRLFDRFHRVPATSGRSAEGSGIGLALTKELVGLLGGEITVDSAPGVGTTFTVTIPRRLDVAGPAVPSVAAGSFAGAFVEEALRWMAHDDVHTGRWPGPGDTPADGRANDGDGDGERDLRVLLADDNADMRTYLARELSQHWRVEAVANGREALERARHWHPHVVVADIMMPGLDGLDLLTELRADPSIADTPVILLSARAGPEAAAGAMDSGADDYLVKPFTLSEVIARVRNRLHAARQRDHAHRRGRRAHLADRVTAALSDCDTVEDVAPALLAVVGAELGAVRTLAVYASDQADTFRILPAGPILDETTARHTGMTQQAPVATMAAMRHGRPILYPSRAGLVADFPAMRADLEANGIEASAHVPFAEGTGALVLLWDHERAFDAEDVATLELVADLTAQAVERIERAAGEHRIAQTLQQELLKLDLRATPAAVAAAYHTSSDQLFVGGDWYDAVPLPDGRLAIAVGDVVGSGLPAAAVMGQLRSAFATAALTEAHPAVVLASLDRFARRTAQAACTTAAYGVIDHAAERFEYTSAGHPPAVLVDPGGTVTLLEEGRSWPLGVRDVDRAGATATVALPAGSLVLLYTDGLIERRGESLDVGIARLVAIVERCWYLPVQALCEQIISALTAERPTTDDIAIMAVRTPGSTGVLYVDVLAGALSEMSAARQRLAQWLAAGPLELDRHPDVVLAVSEAIANAIEHGSRRDPTLPVTVEACLEGDSVLICVTDRGEWEDLRDRTSERRGRGFAVMRALVGDVGVRRAPGNTVVTLRVACHDGAAT